MAYSKAGYKATKKWEKDNIKQVTVKIPINIYNKMICCHGYKNNNQFINDLIIEAIKKYE